MSAVRTRGLAKAYGKTHAVAGVDLDVPAGTVYGLIGPNGSGKTTAMELLAGLRRPTSGQVELAMPQDRVAYAPDAPEFEPWLTAAEVVDVAAGLLRRPRNQGAVANMLERVGLAEAARRRAGGFSRGMRSRLGLAAALIGGPRLLLADEPAAALDPGGRLEMLELLAGLASPDAADPQGPVTVIVSSHDLGDVERICGRIGVMARGRLVYQGRVGELLAQASPALRVVVRPPAGPLLRALSAAPWVGSATQVSPGELRIDVTDHDEAERRLPGVLADCGARLIEVGRAGPSLQDIFFDLTDTGPSRARAMAGG
ncbi:MAG TPA: ABC transporter ATP-binding protein [Streptosporangiaceae bacterium]|nr:ABC transporter ATP-binding protein [Streptosporangiaceae bacterium]